MTGNTKRTRVATEGDVLRAVLTARLAAREIGFDDGTQQMIATAASELARNILKYAGHGEVIVTETVRGKRRGIEVTVRDRGPGIADVDKALQDHFSSSGTLGLGLPGVKRMMDHFEIDSRSGHGTTVLIRKWL